MLVVGSHMEALFVDPDHHGTGVGRALVDHALTRDPAPDPTHNPTLSVDVNEQNAMARRFYERAGFVATGRSDRDGQGRHYPLIHLRHGG